MPICVPSNMSGRNSIQKNDSSLFNFFTLTVINVWRYHKCEWSLHRTNTSVLQPFLQIGDNQGQGRRMRTLQLLPLFDGHEHVRTLWVLQQNLVKKTCPSTVYMVTTYVMTSVFLHVLYCCVTAVVVLFLHFTIWSWFWQLDTDFC